MDEVLKIEILKFYLTEENSQTKEELKVLKKAMTKFNKIADKINNDENSRLIVAGGKLAVLRGVKYWDKLESCYKFCHNNNIRLEIKGNIMHFHTTHYNGRLHLEIKNNI